MLAFLDVGPVARGHALVIPKCELRASRADVDHAVKVTDLPDDQMVDILPACRKIALASGHKDFNILQVGWTRGRLLTSEQRQSCPSGWLLRSIANHSTLTMFTSMSFPNQRALGRTRD